MSKTTHYELNTPIGSEVLSVMTGLNPNFTAIDGVMYDNETRSTQALNKANVNEQNIATALGRITTAEGDIHTLETGLESANTNISGLTSRVSTAETNIVSANNRIQENTNQITEINENLSVTSLQLKNATYYKKVGNIHMLEMFGASMVDNEPLNVTPPNINIEVVVGGTGHILRCGLRSNGTFICQAENGTPITTAELVYGTITWIA